MSEMIEVKTADLVGPALDWAVAYHLNGEIAFFEAFGARMLGRSITEEVIAGNIRPSTDWAHGGPLIEKYPLKIFPNDWRGGVPWLCYIRKNEHVTLCMKGETPIIAAMRAIVASKLVDTVSVPAELL